MPSAEQFELLELLHSDVAETWLAVEKASGRRLLLHKYPKDSGLRERLVTMAPDDLIMLVRADEEGESYIAVTHDVPALRQFRDWVETRSAPATRVHTSPHVAPVAGFDPSKTQRMPKQSIEADEFTRMFSAPPVRDEPNPLVASAPVLANERPAPPQHVAQPVAQTSEFTGMFSAPAVRNEPKSVADETVVRPPLRKEPDSSVATAPVSPNELPAQPPAQPGEFTRMFSAPAVRNEPNPVPDIAPVRPPVRNEPNPTAASGPVLPNELAAPPPVQHVAQPIAQPGEFTRMFSAPAVRNEPKPVPDVAPVRPPVRNEPNPTAASGPVLPNEVPTPPQHMAQPVAQPVTQPGEFTRMFTATPVVRNEPKTASTSAPGVSDETLIRSKAQPALRNEPKTAAPSASTQSSGEFTKMFRAPMAPARSAENPAPLSNSAPSAPSGPGEFTKIFSNPLATTPLADQLEITQPKGLAKAPSHQPSEFTRTFGELSGQGSEAQTSAAPYSPGQRAGATSIFSGPTMSAGGSMPSSAPLGPSEYTRMFQSPGAPAESVQTPAAVAKPEKDATPTAKLQQPSKLWPLVIVLAVLAIAAIALLVYFLMKR